MLRIPVACLTALVAALGVSALAASATVAEEGWTDLLPGGDFSQHWQTKGNWITDKEAGVVNLQPRPGEKGWTRYDMYLWSTKQYTDFEIEFEFKIERGGNSGFYFRVGDKDSPVSKGIEVQISDSYRKGYTGPIKSDHACGGIIGGGTPGRGGGPLKSAAKPAGEWNVFHITVKDNKLTVDLNGERVNELDMTQGKAASRPQTGWIGFQDHGLPLWLRNIKIRELQAEGDQNKRATVAEEGWTDLLPGGDFSQHWQTKGNWIADKEAGVANLQPRPGEKGWTRWDMYLWSTRQYKDFEIEFEFKIEEKGNSGFYFRVGDKDQPTRTGLEVQIGDSYKKGYTGPGGDHSCGGIMGVVSRGSMKSAAKPAGEWNVFHITVKDNKLTVDLNGERVNELDLAQGKAAELSRPGWIGFQDHGLPLWLRNIKIREL